MVAIEHVFGLWILYVYISESIYLGTIHKLCQQPKGGRGISKNSINACKGGYAGEKNAHNLRQGDVQIENSDHFIITTENFIKIYFIGDNFWQRGEGVKSSLILDDIICSQSQAAGKKLK